MLITLVSTRTIDHVPTDGGVELIPGGPGRYVVEALKRLRCDYQLITGDLAQVEVIAVDDAEEYVIPRLAPIELPARLDGDAVIFSPIINEIDPLTVPDIGGLLAVDLQGFVRVPGRPTHEPGKPVDLKSLLTRADLVKGSPFEFARLDEDTRAVLGDRVLAITRGAESVTVVDSGVEQHIAVERVSVPHTIGAGDSFLARMVVGLLKGESPFRAGEEAVGFTTELLRERAAESGVGYTTATRTE